MVAAHGRTKAHLAIGLDAVLQAVQLRGGREAGREVRHASGRERSDHGQLFGRRLTAPTARRRARAAAPRLTSQQALPVCGGRAGVSACGGEGLTAGLTADRAVCARARDPHLHAGLADVDGENLRADASARRQAREG